MVTAKKVVRSVRSKKEDTPSPKKASAGKKVTPQKTIKTSGREKTGRVRIKNNTETRTTSERKAEPKKMESKLARVEALHASKITQGVKPAPLAQVKPVVALALLSPYRFPVQVDQLAHNAARFGGVFFVVLGAFFTMFFANGSFNSASQGAAVTTSTLHSVENVMSGCSGEGSCEMSNPEVSFDVSNRDRLADTVEVKINVRNARSVQLLAYYKTQQQNYTLGTLAQISDDTWLLKWDTTLYSDGEYKLKAFVRNESGSYEIPDEKYVIVENNPLPDGRDDSSGNILDQAAEGSSDTMEMLDDAEQSTEEMQEEEKDAENQTAGSETVRDTITLSADKNRASDFFRFDIESPNADNVKVYSQNIKSNERKLLGYAYEADGSWKFRWLLAGIPSGEYSIQALALEDTEEYASDPVNVEVLTVVSLQMETKKDEVADDMQDSDSMEKNMTPDIAIKIHAPTPLHGIVPVQIAVEDANSVEMYAVPHNSLVQRYIGTARAVDDTIWKFEWDTRQTPNGDYKLLALVQNVYGTYSKDISAGKIQNEVSVTYTEQQQKKIEVLTDIGAVSVEATPERPEPATTPASVMSEAETARVTEEPQVTAETEIAAEQTEQKGSITVQLLPEFKSEIEQELQRLAAAKRMNNQVAVEKVNARLEGLKARIVDEQNGDTAAIDSYFKDAAMRVEESVKKVEKVITERTQEQASKDSDNDNVSDYDEVNIYSTDPYAVDSDNDGFQDGAEILNGYNPIDASAEVLVAYESPKETGVVREDILQVHSVSSAEKNEETETVPAAIISGKALPNSFVTLYIFSTPIVVTLKTDADGSWTYRFDKELEDGEHEVYVGVTDNAGKIVAKSEPFTFVKEAQAFTATDAAVVPETVDVEHSLASQYTIYLVISISVVAIGLVLILLGLHLDVRPRRADAELKEGAAV